MAEFEVATGAAGVPEGDDRGRRAAVQTAFEGLLQIRRLMNADAADPEGVPAEWERRQPVRAVALALEAAGVPPSATDAEGRRTATGYRLGAAEGTGVVRVEWLGPPGSGAGYAAEDALRNCAAVLRRLGWEALEYRGARRHRYLEVEPPPIGPSRS
ncbi:hypothetical protein ACFV27_32870 [Streptomyces antimycoticus]|uniref:Uncharacterized protein n=2 Tax=Streptomyces TaxID=1883 RepID=A0ABP3PJ08_9ACTN|nr:hypothetical protein [Streptomyces sp. AgN23]AJZ84450.1 hypothetical protein AS97_21910 [Streptomyces sp. AgN23]WTA79307.1 hypothetical protein OG751_04545 [Streptomyces antimycoticus]WTB10509.1 hypothetical protein OG546_44020 [Streptomyces antimycoticus]